jgi:hypothetical protein
MLQEAAHKMLPDRLRRMVENKGKVGRKIRPRTLADRRLLVYLATASLIVHLRRSSPGLSRPTTEKNHGKPR